MDDRIDGKFEDAKKNIWNIFTDGGKKKEKQEMKNTIFDFFTGGPDDRELLQKSVNTLKNDRGLIDENFLTPMEEIEKEIIHNEDAVPLSLQTRIFRLKKLLDILNETIVAIENFEDEDDIMENIPEKMLNEVSKEIFGKCAKLNEYCRKNIDKSLKLSLEIAPVDKLKNIPQNKSKVTPNTKTTKETENYIAILHKYIEDILQTLKQIGTDLQKSGIIKAPEKLRHTENIAEDPRVSTVPGFRGHRASFGGRKLSFVGHNAVLVAGTQGQVDMSNAMVADSLLLQMPLKYQTIKETAEVS